MAIITCPGCGHPATADDGFCSQCGEALNRPNGVPEGKLPPDLLAWARQTFNEEQFLAELREVRETGGLHFEDFFSEIAQKVRARE